MKKLAGALKKKIDRQTDRNPTSTFSLSFNSIINHIDKEEKRQRSFFREKQVPKFA
jgi:hypothetical protein